MFGYEERRGGGVKRSVFRDNGIRRSYRLHRSSKSSTMTPPARDSECFCTRVSMPVVIIFFKVLSQYIHAALVKNENEDVKQCSTRLHKGINDFLADLRLSRGRPLFNRPAHSYGRSNNEKSFLKTERVHS